MMLFLCFYSKGKLMKVVPHICVLHLLTSHFVSQPLQLDFGLHNSM